MHNLEIQIILSVEVSRLKCCLVSYDALDARNRTVI